MTSQTFALDAAVPVSTVPDIEFDILHTEVGNARRLLEKYGSEICFHVDRNMWMVWDKTRWVLDPKGRKVAMLVKQVLQEMRNEASAVIAELTPVVADFRDDPTEAEAPIVQRLASAQKMRDWSIKSESDKVVKGTVSQASSEKNVRIVRAQDLDQNPLLLNLLNGTYDLAANELREPRREDLLTRIAPVKYNDYAGCTRFIQFMQEIFPNDPELIGYIQRLLGYTLSGYCIEKVLPFWIGDAGNNGKSALANIVLGILGKNADGYGMEASFNSFIMGKFNEPDKPRNDVMRFEGKRFITASEKDDPSAKLDTELLKKISGNDDLSGRGNYQEDKQFKPQAKIFLRANNKPRVLDSTDSFWNRIKPIRFGQTFDATKANPHLSEEIVQAEASGILNWMIEGWQQVQSAWEKKEVALPDPTSVTKETLEYRTSQSQVTRFFEEKCHVSAAAVEDCLPIKATTIFQRYNDWCEAQGEKNRKNLTAFGNELVRHLSAYPQVKKGPHGKDRQIHWWGIEFLDA